jgi:Domain of unknown function (DUF4037)
VGTPRPDADPLAAADPVLAPLLRGAAADPEALGVVLSGSRGAGLGDAGSDYDVVFVLTEAALAARQERGEPLRVRRLAASGAGGPLPRKDADLTYTSLSRLAERAAAPGWQTYGYVAARVLLDKTGEVGRALAAIAAMPEEAARVDARAWFDASLNAFYRSLKASRRGDELGARLHASSSVAHLVQALFRLERRWPPYHDYLAPQLDTLAEQGWRPGELRAAALAILRTADVGTQVRLEERVEALMRARGDGGVLDAWGDDLERVKARVGERTGGPTEP